MIPYTYTITARPVRLPGQVGRPRLPGPITKEEFKDRVEVAKGSAADVALKALQHLDERFPDDELAKASQILEPSYFKSDSRQGLVDSNHFEVIAKTFGEAKDCNGTLMPALLDADPLKRQANVFVRWMREVVRDSPGIGMQEAWHRLQSPVFSQQCSEWIKAAQRTMVLIAVSVGDERTFSVYGFFRSKLRMSLDTWRMLFVLNLSRSTR